MIVMLWNIIEYTATIIECLICADFSVKFFQPKSQKAKNICFISVFIYDAAVTILLNSLMLYEGALGFIRVIGNFLIMLAVTVILIVVYYIAVYLLKKSLAKRREVQNA